MFDELVGRLEPVLDEPETTNIQFDFEQHAKSIANHILKNDITPFAIAIHGEWGSGKTTLLKCISGKLKDDIPHVIMFEAWKYEKTGIFPALLLQIDKEFGKNLLKHEIAVTTAVAITDLISSTASCGMLGTHIHKIHDLMKDLFEKQNSLEEKMKKIVNEKLVILIDDLDRCDPKNVFSMLENIKSFLRIKNITVVMAADMDMIERSWQLQHPNSPGKIGRGYVEKLFQMNLAIPKKVEVDLSNYVRKFAASFDDETMRYFVNSIPRNLRKIKRAFNALYFTLSSIPEAFDHKTANKENFLYTAITWISIVSNHKEIAEISRLDPSYLVHAAYACSRLNSIDSYQNAIKDNNLNADEPLEIHTLGANFIILPQNLMKPPLVKMLNLIANAELGAFETLRHYGNSFNPDINLAQPNFSSDANKDLLDSHYKTLNYMIHNVMM